ncbi:MAG: 50S ribosomal protein L10 [Woeseia sp.]|nr:50S ribosomal protein L10 [Woeseia sp.]|tara:strand:- start:688 stop:1254 length:567 start_codon:yes stop_codon:yes gene_type:complete
MSEDVSVKGRFGQGKGPREDKVEIIDSLKRQFEGSSSVFLFDYKGLNVSQMALLRRRTRENGIKITVAKNRFIALAVSGTEHECLTERLGGQISIATTETDPTVPAKILKTFISEVDCGKIVGGYLEGDYIESEKVEELADLPPKEVLLGKMLGSIQSPTTGLVGVLGGLINKFLFALNAIAKNKNDM